MPRLTGKNILVTGAGSGIGKAIALTCLSEGARVCVADIDVNSAQRAAEGHTNAMFLSLDIREQNQVEDAVQQTVKTLGRLDGIVANAGRFGRSHPVADFPLPDWEESIRLNLTGTFLTLQAGARRMLAQGRGGSLLATGSSLGIKPAPGQAAYASAKAAVHVLVKAMAVELGGHGIRVNAIAPGVTDTPATRAVPGYWDGVKPMLPLREVAEADEIGALAAYVLSDDARHMTGSVLSLDSGHTAR
jgi:NAD(P)-dependent dehydrogenase (short-subunit alcohol dehydrogenase family)